MNGQKVGEDSSAPLATELDAPEQGLTGLKLVATDKANLSGGSRPRWMCRWKRRPCPHRRQPLLRRAPDLPRRWQRVHGDDHGRRVIGYFTSWRTGKNGLPAYPGGRHPLGQDHPHQLRLRGGG